MAKSAHDLQKKISNGKGPLGPLGTPKKFSNISVEGGSVERTRVEDESDVDRIYQFGEVLGKGAFGVVKEVTSRETGEKYAVKIVPKNKVSSVCNSRLEVRLRGLCIVKLGGEFGGVACMMSLCQVAWV